MAIFLVRVQDRSRLQSLTLKNGAFHFLSTKPNSPNQSDYRKQVSIANLFHRYGFPPSQLQAFLGRNNFLLNSDSRDIEKSLGILFSFKIPQKFLLSLIVDCPGVLEIEFLKKWKLGFAKAGNLAVSPLVTRTVLEYSKRFQFDPDRFHNCLRILNGLGFSELTIRRTIEGFPRVITMKENEICSRIDFLVAMGIPRDDIDGVLSSFPEVLGHGVENKLMPLVCEFADLGFSKELVREEIIKEPRVFGMESGELTRCIQLLRNLKCREPIKWKIFYDGEFRAGFKVKLRVDCLCKHGLIRREAFKILWKEPRVIIYDIEDIEKKIDFLIKTMGYDVGCLVEVPEYLGVSFEKQILPRYKVIQYLDAKGGLGDAVTLKGIIKLSRLRFYNLYVKPYPECEKMFGRLLVEVQVKSQQPIGLWKMFRLPREPDSKEDVKNVKSFMEAIA